MSRSSDVCPYKADPMAFIPELRPEQMLLARMLELACNEYDASEMHIRREARRWVDSDCDNEWSFRWACGELDLEWRELRKVVRDGRWPREGFAKASEWAKRVAIDRRER